MNHGHGTMTEEDRRIVIEYCLVVAVQWAMAFLFALPVLAWG